METLKDIMGGLFIGILAVALSAAGGAVFLRMALFFFNLFGRHLRAF